MRKRLKLLFEYTDVCENSYRFMVKDLCQNRYGVCLFPFSQSFTMSYIDEIDLDRFYWIKTLKDLEIYLDKPDPLWELESDWDKFRKEAKRWIKQKINKFQYIVLK